MAKQNNGQNQNIRSVTAGSKRKISRFTGSRQKIRLRSQNLM